MRNITIKLGLLLATLFGAPILLGKNMVQVAPVKIAIVDTGYDTSDAVPLCPGLSADFSTESNGAHTTPDKSAAPNLSDEFNGGHGTHVLRLIEAELNASTNYCFIIVKVYSGANSKLGRYIEALKYVQSLHPTFVNLSLEGTLYLEAESTVIKQILDTPSIVVAAAGNRGTYLSDLDCTAYPACVDKRIIVVGALHRPSSNWGSRVTLSIEAPTINGRSGTSFAAPIVTGRLVNTYLKRELADRKISH